MTTDDVAVIQRTEQDGLTLLGQADEIEIHDDSTFQQAGVFLRSVAGYVKRVGEYFDPICRATDEAHKTAVRQRARLLEPAEAAKKVVNDAMVCWEQAEKDRVAREQRAAEQERQRLEDEQRLQQAEELEKAGKKDEAQAVLTAPVETPVFVPPVQAAQTKVDGVGFRGTWSAEVKNLMELVKAVAAGKADIGYLEANQKALNGLARSLRKKDLGIPGVEGKESRSTAVRA